MKNNFHIPPLPTELSHMLWILISWGRNIRHLITSTLGCAKLFTYHYDKICNFNYNFVFTTTSYDVSHTLMRNYYTTADTTPYHYVPLHKQYEFSNHLGNVLVTISARPRLIYDNQTFEYKEADVMSVSDYEPGGFPTPGRQFNSESYRFGHNTQEKVNEWNGTTGTHYTALFWEYDSRLIWRQNPDPKGTPSVSPYSCFGGNPIGYNDVLGDIWDPDWNKNFSQKEAQVIGKTALNLYNTSYTFKAAANLVGSTNTMYYIAPNHYKGGIGGAGNVIIKDIYDKDYKEKHKDEGGNFRSSDKTIALHTFTSSYFEPTTIFEEGFHAAQDVYYGSGRNPVLLEVEAKLARAMDGYTLKSNSGKEIEALFSKNEGLTKFLSGGKLAEEEKLTLQMNLYSFASALYEDYGYKKYWKKEDVNSLLETTPDASLELLLNIKKNESKK